MVEEVKEKSLIDRFWWIIPPVFVFCVYWPLFGMATNKTYTFYSWISDMKDFVGTYYYYTLSIFAFIGIGYFLLRNRPVIYRIIIPSIFGVIAYWVVLFIMIIMYGG